MLIDFIPVEKLPHWLVWLDWCLYAYWPELLMYLGGCLVLWIIYCLFIQGTGVG